MDPSNFLISRPPLEMNAGKENEFRRLWKELADKMSGSYNIPFPKWQFLSYICEHMNLVLHGSQHRNLDCIEPRQANDIRSFSNQKAIYATTDGIWAIFFAIMNRVKFREMSLFNSCLQAQISADEWSDPLYFFSITHSALLQKPFCTGSIYILDRSNFYREPATRAHGMDIVFPHWISHDKSEIIGSIDVSPEDFPFLEQVHGHDDERLEELVKSNPDGFPWPDALVK